LFFLDIPFFATMFILLSYAAILFLQAAKAAAYGGGRFPK
jgi:hypothetical protein